MASQKIVQIFLSLDKKERSGIKKKLHGLDVNIVENYSLKLFNTLVRLFHSMKYESFQKMSSAHLSLKAFGNDYACTDKEQDKRNQRFSELVKHINDFFILNRVNQNVAGKNRAKLLLEIYEARGLDHLACNLAENKIKKLKAKKWKNLADYEELVVLINYLYSYPITDQSRNKKHLLEKIYLYKSIILTISMLKDSCSLLMKGIEYKTNDDKSKLYLKQSEQTVQNYQLEKYWEVKIFLQAVTLLAELNHENYQSLRKLFDEYQNILMREDKKKLLKYLINAAYTLYLETNNRDYYFEQLYGLHKIGFSNSMFDDKNGKVNSDLLVNYIVTSVDYSQWLYNPKDTSSSELPNLYAIISDNVGKLYPQDERLIELLASAYIEYFYERYEKSLGFISDYSAEKKYRTISDRLRLRSLKLRIYVEQAEKHKVLTSNRSFLSFLEKNIAGFSETQVESHKNFIQLTKDLFNKKLSKRTLLQRIEKQKLLACRNWLKLQVMKTIN